jgi:asparagine synthetase A
MQDFSGLQGELVLAKYILENAKNLKTMIIWCKSKSSKIQRKLAACLKASATCQLSVYIGK